MFEQALYEYDKEFLSLKRIPIIRSDLARRLAPFVKDMAPDLVEELLDSMALIQYRWEQGEVRPLPPLKWPSSNGPPGRLVE